MSPVSACAATQDEIDALRAERDAIRAQRLEKQAVVDQLEEEQAGILEQKRALDERNLYTLQQIQLNDEEIALYDEMIAEKENELLNAQELEDEQLERYRTRVRAMEENGTLNYLALILNTTDLGELLTTMDDIGEIMQSDRELEDEYIRARENTEEVKAEYEATARRSTASRRFCAEQKRAGKGDRRGKRAAGEHQGRSRQPSRRRLTPSTRRRRHQRRHRQAGRRAGGRAPPSGGGGRSRRGAAAGAAAAPRPAIGERHGLLPFPGRFLCIHLQPLR